MCHEGFIKVGVGKLGQFFHLVRPRTSNFDFDFVVLVEVFPFFNPFESFIFEVNLLRNIVNPLNLGFI